MVNRRDLLKKIVFLVIIVVFIGAFDAFSASNNVSGTYLHESDASIYPIDLLPTECDGMVPLWIYTPSGGGWLSGSADPDLMLGTDKVDRMRGHQSGDCMVGGDGNDRLYGNTGADIILGGDGNDIIEGGADNDIIYAGDGRDTVIGGPGYDICYGGGGGDRARDFDCEEVYFP